jgi:hypothetical protein
MENPVTLQLYSYWNRLKGARQAPERSEIEPSDIKELLPDTFILETDSLEGTSFRLAGTRTCALFGRDLKNADFLKLWPENDQTALESSLRLLRDEATVVSAKWEGRTARYHDTSGELILLPLIQDNAVCRILGTLVTTEPPYWLGTFPLKTLTLTGLRMVPPHEHSNPVYSKTPVPAVHPLLGTNRPSRQIRHLSLFEGGRGNA